MIKKKKIIFAFILLLAIAFSYLIKKYSNNIHIYQPISIEIYCTNKSSNSQLEVYSITPLNKYHKLEYRNNKWYSYFSFHKDLIVIANKDSINNIDSCSIIINNQKTVYNINSKACKSQHAKYYALNNKNFIFPNEIYSNDSILKKVISIYNWHIFQVLLKSLFCIILIVLIILFRKRIYNFLHKLLEYNRTSFNLSISFIKKVIKALLSAKNQISNYLINIKLFLTNKLSLIKNTTTKGLKNFGNKLNVFFYSIKTNLYKAPNILSVLKKKSIIILKYLFVLIKYSLIILLYFVFIIIFQIISSFLYGYILPEKILSDYNQLMTILRIIDIVFVVVLMLVFIIKLSYLFKKIFKVFSITIISFVSFLIIFNYLILPNIDFKNSNNKFFSFLNFPYNFINEPTWNNSKSNYITTFGDSYTFGNGDWLFDSGFLFLNKPSNYSFILKDELHTDVLNMGKTGTCSVSSIIQTPLIDYKIIKEKLHLNNAKATLFFFYEGNDISDNIQDILKYKKNFPDEELNYINFKKWLKYFSLKNYEPIERSITVFPTISFFSWISIVTFAYKWFYILSIYPQQEIYKPNVNYIAFKSGIRKLPLVTQSPSLEYSNTDVDKGLLILEYSLKYYRETNKDTNTYLIFIPSVMSCYNYVSNISLEILPKSGGAFIEKIYKPEYLYERNKYIRDKIYRICKEFDYKYIDTNDSIRKHSKQQLLHGPKDWGHFNKNGQILLGKIVADVLKKDLKIK